MTLQPPDLKKLTPEQKDELILELWAVVQAQREQIDALTKRVEAQERDIADLKTNLGEPPKTPDNSSVPPSRGQKPTPWAGRNEPACGKAVLDVKAAGVGWQGIPMKSSSPRPDVVAIARQTLAMRIKSFTAGMIRSRSRRSSPS
jgi:hypothetical protein